MTKLILNLLDKLFPPSTREQTPEEKQAIQQALAESFIRLGGL